MKLTTNKLIVIFTVVSAALLQLIDTSIVNVALTDIMGNLGASFEEAGWVVTGYAVSNVIMITLSGWMSAKFGRKTPFLGACRWARRSFPRGSSFGCLQAPINL